MDVKASELATNLSKGGCDNYKELSILEDYIKQLSQYSLTDTDSNCITEDNLETIVEQSKHICDLCDCGTH